MLNRKMTYIGLVLVAFLGLTGCNTMEGAGEDIEEAGEEIQEGAGGGD